MLSPTGERIEIPQSEFCAAQLSPASGRKSIAPLDVTSNSSVRKTEEIRMTPTGKKVKLKIVTKSVNRRSYSQMSGSIMTSPSQRCTSPARPVTVVKLAKTVFIPQLAPE